MKVLDLSHAITRDMPVFPGSESPQLKQIHSIQEDGFAEKRLSLYSHIGTHVDGPAHVLADGATLDALAIDRFFGNAICLPVDANSPIIDESYIAGHGKKLAENDFVLFYTGWENYWQDDRYFSEYPVLSREAAALLCRLNLKGVGFDTISADREESHDLPIHRILLEKMVIIENLTNLAALAGKTFFFSCPPLSFQDADGSPVRAAAILTEEGSEP